LRELGVERGGVLVVHTAFSKVGPLEGGPRTLIDALLDAVGSSVPRFLGSSGNSATSLVSAPPRNRGTQEPRNRQEGTLVMPSMSDDDEHPFDVATTSCRSLGIVAETFRRLPGVLRSDNPHAFAAIGPRAAEILAPHPIDVPHGLNSPIGRVYELDGQVLLLGAGHDANTTIHLAENLAGVRYRIRHHVTLPAGRFEYDEIDHCCENFALMDGWIEQRRGVVGNAEARLMRSRDVVAAALEHLRRNELVFLHEKGACEECDLARRALPPPNAPPTANVQSTK